VTELLARYDAWAARWSAELEESSREAERTCDYRKHDERAADMREEAEVWADKAMEALREGCTRTALSADHGHVLLDAINALRSGIEHGDEPWTQYTSGEADPKATPEGYETLLDEAQAAVTAAVEHG
jgi:hypothetical protein